MGVGVGHELVVGAGSLGPLLLLFDGFLVVLVVVLLTGSSLSDDDCGNQGNDENH